MTLLFSLNELVLNRFDDSIVCFINIDIVIGPTPPGTGVICDANVFTSLKLTSPTILYPRFLLKSNILFIPMSITTTPSLTCSFVIKLGTPHPTTNISADFVFSFKFFVLIWQNVRAFHLITSNLMAFQLPQPTTTTSLPSILCSVLNFTQPLIQGALLWVIYSK